jgi:hypothetical protein
VSREVIIDNMTIRLPNGWNGDPVHLARAIATQLQQQAGELASAESLSLKVQSHYGGSHNRVAEQISRELVSAIWKQGRRSES